MKTISNTRLISLGSNKKVEFAVSIGVTESEFLSSLYFCLNNYGPAELPTGLKSISGNELEAAKCYINNQLDILIENKFFKILADIKPAFYKAYFTLFKIYVDGVEIDEMD